MKFKNIIFLLLGIGFLVYLLEKIDFNVSNIIHLIVDPKYVIFSVLIMTFLVPVMTGLRMKYIILPMEKKEIPLRDLSKIEYVYKFLSNVMPFKLNVPAKAVLLKNQCGIRLSGGASAVSFEYTLDAAIIIMFGFLGALAYFRNDARISFDSIEYFMLITLICAIGFFSIPTDFFGKLLKKTETISVKAIRAFLMAVVNLLWAIRGTWAKLLLHREMIIVLASTAVLWGFSISFNEFLFLSMGRYVPPTWIIVAISGGLFIGGISTIPGGLGAREAASVLVYSYLGIPNEASVAVVLTGRALTVLPILIGYTYTLKIGYDKITQYKMETKL